MITSEEFYEIFKQRHDFRFDDIALLRMMYPNVHFSKIPEAWTPVIDTYLKKLKSIDKVKEIYQLFGFLVIDHSVTLKADLNKLKKMEQAIKNIDQDLYKDLSKCDDLN